MYFSKLLLSDIIEFAIAKGANRGDLCRKMDVELSDTTHPGEQISYDKMVDVLNIAGQAINDEFLGLHIGEQMALKGKRQVDDIMQNSPTIEEAFSNAIIYSKLISDALTSRMSKTAEYTTISFEVNPNWAVLQNYAVQQIIDMTLVCTLKSIYWLTGARHTPVAVHLNHPSLKKKNEYYKVFDCPIRFNEKTPCIIFQNPILNRPVRSPDLRLLDYLKNAADEEIKKIQTEPPIIIAIKEIILENLPEKKRITEVAAILHLSPRTLQRRLLKLNTNYKKIEREIILKLAQKIILNEERNIDEISYLLGFSETSSLIRFFKNEMKTTPKKYQKMLLSKKPV